MPRRKKGNPIHGWINFYKPIEMSSASAVNFVRWLYNAQKAGHGGTLDPLAEGVLPIALGDATKALPFMLEGDKYYRFDVQFGTETETDDLEGSPIATSDKNITQNDLEQILHNFKGEISQTPPAYSALKINGKRACDLMREGKDVQLEPRPITIHEITLDRFSNKKQTATLSVHVSKGTYVRALARDIGRVLGCYAHVTRLTRTKHGIFTENTAVHKKDLEKYKEIGHIPPTLLEDVDVVLDDIPVLTVTPTAVEQLLRGMAVQTDTMQDCEVVRVKNESGYLVSLAKIDQGTIQPKRNFPDLIRKNDIANI